MSDSLHISSKVAELKSMRYHELRTIGLEHIQNLSGKLWTDYNTHDPGVTILEVLCYAITDLGNRANQDIRHIITPNPNDPEQDDIKNFFTAAEILPGKALTLTDLRKIIIDVAVAENNDDSDFTGVKNAWLSTAQQPEVDVWVNKSKSKLVYAPVDKKNPDQEKLGLHPLYNILLEFETSQEYGDLNRNDLTDRFVLGEISEVIPELRKAEVSIQIEFPVWDNDSVDWDSNASILAAIQSMSVQFFKTPPGYQLEAEWDTDYNIDISGTYPNAAPIDIASDLNPVINQLVLDLVDFYRGRINKTLQIVEKVKQRLHANRNLCEDYLSFGAMKIERVAVCADVEIGLMVNVNEVQAQILHAIEKFLSPNIPYYSLGDLVEKGVPTEEIFEGPLLEHGFMLDEDLQKSDRIKVVYVSDLIRIIMGIEGVEAVKHIEIANFPGITEDKIASKSVKWCLELAFDKNYVPRLSVQHSKLTFYKERLPYQANASKVKERIDELQSLNTSGKLFNKARDFSIPKGEYLNLESYSSIKEDFPATYGIGFDGLTKSTSDERKAQAKQLKGYLLFFEQLLANYMAQLSHVKDLFSMNAARNEEGKYKIGRTYFTRPLTDSLPKNESLFVNPGAYSETLKSITEDDALFLKRRNKFLDHLMARFAEDFTNYAALTYQISGLEGEKKLISNKLSLLNAYPAISSGRGLALNYKRPDGVWHIENKSGLEKRVALLTGIETPTANHLAFSPKHFHLIEDAGSFKFHVSNELNDLLLKSPLDISFSKKHEALLAIEALILAGMTIKNYVVWEEEGHFHFHIVSNEKVLAKGFKTDYPSMPQVESDINALIDIFTHEFYNNHQSNRNNLTAPITNYFQIEQDLDGLKYSMEYKLYSTAFSQEPQHELMRGTIEGEVDAGLNVAEETEKIKNEWIWDVIVHGCESRFYMPFTEDSNEQFRLVSRLGRVLGESKIGIENPDALITFFTDKFFSKEGLHLIEHLLLRPKNNDHAIRDPLMPVNISPEHKCCQVINPYTCVATVVLPYWQGRFKDMNFRRYFEQKIRLEAPAHVYLKICWISNEQMGELEKHYKHWLILNAHNNKAVLKAETSKALENLLNTIDNLSNVYPAGRLHDCENHETLEEAVILNNSSLGNI